LGGGKLNLSLKSGNLKMEVLARLIISLSRIIEVALRYNAEFPFLGAGLQRFSTQLASVNLPGVKLMARPMQRQLKTWWINRKWIVSP